VGKSLKEYIIALGYWGLVVIAPIILDTIGIYQLVTNNQVIGLPSWVWFQIAFVFLLLIPFIAFHKVNSQLRNLTEGRKRELSELILQARDAATRVILTHNVKGFTDEIRQLHNSCKEALITLNRQGEIDGGEIKDIIYGFTTFIGTNIDNYLTGSMVSQREAISICNLIGNNTDQTMENIRKSLRK
jgi:hypothetical protein